MNYNSNLGINESVEALNNFNNNLEKQKDSNLRVQIITHAMNVYSHTVGGNVDVNGVNKPIFEVMGKITSSVLPTDKFSVETKSKILEIKLALELAGDYDVEKDYMRLLDDVISENKFKNINPGLLDKLVERAICKIFDTPPEGPFESLGGPQVRKRFNRDIVDKCPAELKERLGLNMHDLLREHASESDFPKKILDAQNELIKDHYSRVSGKHSKKFSDAIEGLSERLEAAKKRQEAEGNRRVKAAEAKQKEMEASHHKKALANTTAQSTRYQRVDEEVSSSSSGKLPNKYEKLEGDGND